MVKEGSAAPSSDAEMAGCIQDKGGPSPAKQFLFVYRFFVCPDAEVSERIEERGCRLAMGAQQRRRDATEKKRLDGETDKEGTTALTAEKGVGRGSLGKARKGNSTSSESEMKATRL